MELKKGQRALIAGGSEGIGEAFARSFGAEGASVVIAGRNGEKAQRIASDIVKAGGKAIGVTCDVTQQSDCDALIAATLAEYVASIPFLQTMAQPEKLARWCAGAMKMCSKRSMSTCSVRCILRVQLMQL